MCERPRPAGENGYFTWKGKERNVTTSGGGDHRALKDAPEIAYFPKGERKPRLGPSTCQKRGMSPPSEKAFFFLSRGGGIGRAAEGRKKNTG